jgi:hypothetical protein
MSKQVTIYKNGEEWREDKWNIWDLIKYLAKLNEIDKSSNFTYEVNEPSIFDLFFS